jgi:hypothetical protein
MTVVTKTDMRRMRDLEARVLVVMDKAVGAGNAALGASVNAVLEYLRDPNSDPSSAAALVAALERQAGVRAAPAVKPPIVAVTPGAVVDGATAKPVLAGSFGAFGWWSTLSDTQRAVYGVGTVALLVLAYKLWSDKK